MCLGECLCVCVCLCLHILPFPNFKESSLPPLKSQINTCFSFWVKLKSFVQKNDKKYQKKLVVLSLFQKIHLKPGSYIFQKSTPGTYLSFLKWMQNILEINSSILISGGNRLSFVSLMVGIGDCTAKLTPLLDCFFSITQPRINRYMN